MGSYFLSRSWKLKEDKKKLGVDVRKKENKMDPDWRLSPTLVHFSIDLCLYPSTPSAKVTSISTSVSIYLYHLFLFLFLSINNTYFQISVLAWSWPLISSFNVPVWEVMELKQQPLRFASEAMSLTYQACPYLRVLVFFQHQEQASFIIPVSITK